MMSKPALARWISFGSFGNIWSIWVKSKRIDLPIHDNAQHHHAFRCYKTPKKNRRSHVFESNINDHEVHINDREILDEPMFVKVNFPNS